MAVGKNGQGQARKEAYTNAILQDISDSFNKPCDHKQVKNIAEAEKRKALSGHLFAKTNIAK